MTLLDQIRDAADELTEPHIHTEPVVSWDTNRNRKIRPHQTVQPGLLAQLYQSVMPTWSTSTEYGGSIPNSRPPLALEALSCHDDIAQAVMDYCDKLDLRLRGTPESNLRALVGAAATLDDNQQRALLADMRRWRRWCAVMTGWETLYQPAKVRCYIDGCDQTNTLRINLTTKTAYCRACGSTWSEDDGSISILATYITEATQHRDTNTV